MFYSYDKDQGKLTSEKFGGTIVFKNFNVVCVTEITLKNLALVSDSGELIIFDNNKLCSKFECSLTEKAETAEIIALPGFDRETFPFLALGINNRIYIANLGDSSIT